MSSSRVVPPSFFAVHIFLHVYWSILLTPLSFVFSFVPHFGAFTFRFLTMYFSKEKMLVKKHTSPLMLCSSLSKRLNWVRVSLCHGRAASKSQCGSWTSFIPNMLRSLLSWNRLSATFNSCTTLSTIITSSSWAQCMRWGKNTYLTWRQFCYVCDMSPKATTIGPHFVWQTRSGDCPTWTCNGTPEWVS